MLCPPNAQGVGGSEHHAPGFGFSLHKVGPFEAAWWLGEAPGLEYAAEQVFPLPLWVLRCPNASLSAGFGCLGHRESSILSQHAVG